MSRSKQRLGEPKEAAVIRLGRAHARAAAIRAETLHRFTAALSREHGVIVVEDLADEEPDDQPVPRAGAIGDQGWGELARQLGYKTARHGGRLIVADRWFASS